MENPEVSHEGSKWLQLTEESHHGGISRQKMKLTLKAIGLDERDILMAR